jgi:hypothetical protein
MIDPKTKLGTKVWYVIVHKTADKLTVWFSAEEVRKPEKLSPAHLSVATQFGNTVPIRVLRDIYKYNIESTDEFDYNRTKTNVWSNPKRLFYSKSEASQALVKGLFNPEPPLT